MLLRKLSELEGVCLGDVHTYQPCTAYSVRRRLRQSPSSHWRASAGSVYPLLTRLEAAGLVSTTADESDGRGRKLLNTTPAGKKALGEWIMAGADAEVVAAMMDPLRSRMFFMDVLRPTQQSRHLKNVIELTEALLKETRTRLECPPEPDSVYGHLAVLGAHMVTQTRLDWLKQAQTRLQELGVVDSDPPG